MLPKKHEMSDLEKSVENLQRDVGKIAGLEQRVARLQQSMAEIHQKMSKLDILEKLEKLWVEEEERQESEMKVKSHEEETQKTGFTFVQTGETQGDPKAGKPLEEHRSSSSEVKNESLVGKSEIPVFDDELNQRDDEQARYARQVFDTMILGENRVVRKRKKRNFTKAK